jgi:hypothetical protein
VRLETKNDVRLVGRAIREGWDFDRSKVVAALMELVENRNPDLMMDAIDKLQRGDEINIKRELLELKKLGDENLIRLRLLELARHAEPDELARLASENGIAGRRIAGADE